MLEKNKGTPSLNKPKSKQTKGYTAHGSRFEYGSPDRLWEKACYILKIKMKAHHVKSHKDWEMINYHDGKQNSIVIMTFRQSKSGALLRKVSKTKAKT